MIYPTRPPIQENGIEHDTTIHFTFDDVYR